ncbi:MAG: DUF3244 domain-containing protein [Bacteroidales bacterium]|nr:DUF3244 domain-containing protein [Bacteroidales bacterium]
MKHFFLHLLLPLLATLFVLPFPISAHSHQDDQQPILINVTLPGQSGNRGSLQIPFEAVLSTEALTITIVFQSEIGYLDVSITNLSTGSSTNTNINSAAGNIGLPVTGGSGLYYIELCATDVIYYGYFTI